MSRSWKSTSRWPTSSDVVRKLLGYVVLATLARTLSNADMASCSSRSRSRRSSRTLTDLGTGRYLTRKVAQDQERALVYLSEVLSLRLPAVVIAFLLLNAIAFLFMRERAHILLRSACSFSSATSTTASARCSSD